MGWARMDDGYMDHPKILEAGPWCELLDRRGIEYCAAHDTDGLITPSALKKIGREIPKVAARVLTLVAVGRWTPNEGGGWWVHDFLAFNPSKAERGALRESGRARQAAWRERARNAVTNAEVTKGRGGESVVGPKMVARCKRCDRLTVDCECPPLALVAVEGLREDVE